MPHKYITLHPNAKDITGQTFGRLTALAPVGRTKGKKILWEFQCDCGEKTVTTGSRAITGKTRSCGCLQDESRTKHGLSRGRVYHTWQGMKRRCLNPNAPYYKDYGGRGIKVCARWLNSFENFYADMGERPEGLSLDRIDNDGNYEPSNCRWATKEQQANNKRNNRNITFGGKAMNVTQWARHLEMKVDTLHARLTDHGWPIEKALTTPVKKYRPRKSSQAESRLE